MKVSELKTKTSEELVAELADLHKEQFDLRMQKNTNEAAGLHNFKRVRRKIAQVKTILN